MTERGRFRKRITHPFTAHTLGLIRAGFASLSLNRYEALAVQGMLEALENLIARQAVMDDLRKTFPMSPTGMQQPTPDQRRRLFELTKAFFDSYYSTMSHVLSVVARFSSVFGRITFTEITPFIPWLGAHAQFMSHGAIEDLERARLFRAILNHPQQFPVVDWGTSVDAGTRELAYVHLFGPESPKGKIPPGSTRSDPLAAPGDWVMNAPDELSVLNCVSNAATFTVIDVLAARSAGSSFKSAETRRNEAITFVFGRPPPGVDAATLID